jgi:GAF domain-containing protein
MFNDYLLGFLVLNSSKKNYFTSIHVQRLQAFVNQAAVAIRNAQLYAQAQEAAALEERQRLARDMHD